MKGEQIRGHLEDRGYLILVGGPLSFFVRTPHGKQIAFYDLCDDDLSYRFGWVELGDSEGRLDCLSWLEFSAELMERAQS